MIMISWSLSYPTYFTFALLVWSCIELLLFSRPFFNFTRYPVLIFSGLYLLMQNIYNIDLGMDLPVSLLLLLIEPE